MRLSGSDPRFGGFFNKPKKPMTHLEKYMAEEEALERSLQARNRQLKKERSELCSPP
jgi:hypothetical protein